MRNHLLTWFIPILFGTQSVFAQCITGEITSGFNATDIAQGRYIWFNSHLKSISGASLPVTIYVDNAYVEFEENGTIIHLAIPPATINVNPANTTASTSFNGTRWITNVPSTSGDPFMAGLSYLVPAPGLEGAEDVTWSACFSASKPNLCFHWQWSAAVYVQFSPAPNYNELGVLPVDGGGQSGTPMNFAYSGNSIGGARGGGSSNYTGSNSSTGDVCPPVPVELSSFTASFNRSIVNLNWETKTEVNNYGFEVERASNNQVWEKIGFVSGSGNSNSPKAYSYTDKTASSGKYTYRLKQIDTDGDYSYSKEAEVDLGRPAAYSLEQNYPNPFNPTTKISYQIPVQSAVQIDVFNSIGEKVAALVNEVKEPGYYEVEFNAENLSSGIYMYKIQSGKYTATKKMILLK